ncbi:hypothetical protein [Prevotella sp. HUN102]|uniref:hypothetical protein n=1 Tax=Prevotella sp. HUN102 TaxID=1392486 RepID=UPI0005680B0F|nr:hypothetical protein [Prevotella sp. HUN102]
MNVRKLFSAILLVAFCVSCNNDDNPSPMPPTPEVAPQSVVFATSIPNPEGNTGSVYLQAIPNLNPAKYDNKNSIPTGFAATPIAFPDGDIYSLPAYSGNTKAEMVRYRLNTQNRFVSKGTLALPAGSGASCIVKLNAQKAYLTLQNLGLIYVFNPETMKLLKEINLNKLSHADTKVSPAAMIIRDGYLYVGLSQFDSKWQPRENKVEIALINTAKDELEKVIVNDKLGVSVPTRPTDAKSIFMDEHQNIYINCISGFGANTKQYPAGIIRIKKGTHEIDSDYCIRLDKTKVTGLPVNYADYLPSVFYAGNGKLYAYANAYALDTHSKNPYTTLSRVPVIIDLNAKTIEKIEGFPVSTPFGEAIGRHKGVIVFGSANRDHNGFYTYDPESKKVTGPVVSVEGYPSFFYSFSKE